MPNKDSDTIFYATLKGVLDDFGLLQGPKSEPLPFENPKVVNGRLRTIKERESQSTKCYKVFNDLSCKFQLSLDEKHKPKKTNIVDKCYDNKIYVVKLPVPDIEKYKTLPTSIRKYASDSKSTNSMNPKSVSSVAKNLWGNSVNIGLPINIPIPNISSNFNFELARNIVTVPQKKKSPLILKTGKTSVSKHILVNVENIKLQKMESKQMVSKIPVRKTSTPILSTVPELQDRTVDSVAKTTKVPLKLLPQTLTVPTSKPVNHKTKILPSESQISVTERHLISASKKLPIIVLRDIKNKLTPRQREQLFTSRNQMKKGIKLDQHPQAQIQRKERKIQKRKHDNTLIFDSGETLCTGTNLKSIVISPKLYGQEITPLTPKRCKILCRKIE